MYSEIDLHERLRVAVGWRDMQAARVGVKPLLEMVSNSVPGLAFLGLILLQSTLPGCRSAVGRPVRLTYLL